MSDAPSEAGGLVYTEAAIAKKFAEHDAKFQLAEDDKIRQDRKLAGERTRSSIARTVADHTLSFQASRAK